MKKPKFIQQDTNRKKSLKLKWRKPTGIHSKLRLNKSGHRKKPSPGYRSPRKVRYFILGMKANKVSNLNDLGNIAEGAALLSSNLGAKKKLLIVKKAKDLGIKILNIKNIDEFIKLESEKFENRKSSKKSKQLEKKKSKEKAVNEAKKKEVEKSDEEKQNDKDVHKHSTHEHKEHTDQIVDAPQKQAPQMSRARAPMQK